MSEKTLLFIISSILITVNLFGFIFCKNNDLQNLNKEKDKKTIVKNITNVNAPSKNRMRPIIISGDLAHLESFPHAASIVSVQNYIVCTATIIAPMWCLTAAHCIEDYNMASMVKFNTNGMDYGGDIAHISFLFKHPDYRPFDEIDKKIARNDIGLVQTFEIMILSVSKPYPYIADYKKYAHSTSLRAYGFGVSGNEHIGLLVTANLTIEGESMDYCTPCIKVVLTTATTHQPAASCYADAGGPGLSGNYLFAIIFRANYLTRRQNPECGGITHMTVVFPFRDIIFNTINDSKNGSVMDRIYNNDFEEHFAGSATANSHSLLESILFFLIYYMFT